jgi:aspartate-semialdehyde dehydrogenase
MSAALRVGVVGATGQVGGVMRRLLAERNFPVAEIRYFASARSAGTTLPWLDNDVVVEDAATADPSGLDIALFSAGAASSRTLAPKFAAAGAIVIDNSSAFRMDPEVPLVVSEVNGHLANNPPKGIIANPNCTTLSMIVALGALHRRFGLESLFVASYQAASGAGQPGIDRLYDELASLEGDRTSADLPGGVRAKVPMGPSPFPAPLALNVVPMAGSLKDGGWTSEELKVRNESR